MSELRHEFRFVIRTSPERLWRALTTPDDVKRYYFGFDLYGRFEPGEEYTLSSADHGPQIEGETVEAEAPSRLVQTFRFASGDDPASRITFSIEPWGREAVRLTLVHDGFENETDTYRDVAGGWPAILSGLKTWLETGEPLRYVPVEEG